MAEPSAELVRLAHGDAWQAMGRLRAAVGGEVAERPGIRLMASGLPHPQWNNGDVDDPGAVEIAAVAAWYADRGVPWGVRVPAGATWPHGRLLFRKRLMAVPAADLIAAAPPDGVRMRTARPADLEDVLAVDLAAFGGAADLERRWLEPLLSAGLVALAEADGEVVATGYGVPCEGRAGSTVFLGGVAVRPDVRRRGIGAAVSSRLAERGFAAGGQIAHLHPDTDEAASIYRRLGFVEVDGLDIYVDNV